VTSSDGAWPTGSPDDHGPLDLGGLGQFAVSAWSLVHGLSALWISGRLADRITEQDPQRLAAAVSDLFVQAVLPPAGITGTSPARPANCGPQVSEGISGRGRRSGP
jgi:hypothetical protein